jgi:hypothetical protein
VARGPVNHGNTYGVVAHAMIAVDADSHASLALVGRDVQTWDGVVTEYLTGIGRCRSGNRGVG